MKNIKLWLVLGLITLLLLIVGCASTDTGDKSNLADSIQKGKTAGASKGRLLVEQSIATKQNKCRIYDVILPTEQEIQSIFGKNLVSAGSNGNLYADVAQNKIIGEFCAIRYEEKGKGWSLNLNLKPCCIPLSYEQDTSLPERQVHIFSY